MSIVEKRSHSRAVDYAAVDDGMSATTSISIALAVALILYVLGSAIFQRNVVAGGPQQAGSAEMEFHGP
jgi:hypothetical protein